MPRSFEVGPYDRPLPVVSADVEHAIIGAYIENPKLLSETYERLKIQQPELLRQMARFDLYASRDIVEQQAMTEAMVLTYLSLEIQFRADHLEAQSSPPAAPRSIEVSPHDCPLPVVSVHIKHALIGANIENPKLLSETYKRLMTEQPELIRQMARYIQNTSRDNVDRQSMTEAVVITYLSLEAQARVDQLEAQFNPPTNPEAPFA